MTVSATVDEFEGAMRRGGGGSVLTVSDDQGGFELRPDDGAIWPAELPDEHGGQTGQTRSSKRPSTEQGWRHSRDRLAKAPEGGVRHRVVPAGSVDR